MMLQHPGLGLGLGTGLGSGLGPSEISVSALVPCLSPPGSLTLDDFTHFSPLVKEELRYAIHNKRLSGGMSSSNTSCSGYSPENPTEPLRPKRELTTEEVDRRKRRRKGTKSPLQSAETRRRKRQTACKKESEKLESVNAELKAQIEELKNQKQQLVYMLNLHRPTCIVRAHNGQTPEDERNLFIQQIKETTLQCMSFTTADSVDPVLLDVCEGPHL